MSTLSNKKYMSIQNPYAPPAAALSDASVSFSRSEFGLRLGASLLWRALLLQSTITVPVAISMVSLNEFFTLKPTVIYLCLAFALALSALFVKSSALFIFWGRRLGLTATAWRRFNWMLFWLYVTLGIGNIVLVLTAPVAVWVQVKLFVPFLSLVALCMIAPRFLRNAA